jgi:nucleolin
VSASAFTQLQQSSIQYSRTTTKMVEDEAKKKRKRSKSKKKEKKEKVEIDEDETTENQQDETEQVDGNADVCNADVGNADADADADEEPQLEKEDTVDGAVAEVMETEEKDGEDKPNGDEDAPVKPKRKRTRKRKKLSDDAAGDDDNTDTTLSAADKEAAMKLQSLDYTIYVEGIPFDVSEEDVKEFFVTHGCADIIQMRLSRWQDSGRLRGYGHVVFDTTESREKAIAECNGKHMGKRYLSIQAPKQPRPDTLLGSSTQSTPRDQPTGCNVVFVKNLPYHAAEGDVQDAFQVCGKIVEGGVRIVRNYQTRQSKGFAYVEYKNPEGAHGSVQKASKPFGMKVLGRPVFVDYDEGRMRGSFKNEDGRLWSKEHTVSKK